MPTAFEEERDPEDIPDPYETDTNIYYEGTNSKKGAERVFLHGKSCLVIKCCFCNTSFPTNPYDEDLLAKKLLNSGWSMQKSLFDAKLFWVCKSCCTKFELDDKKSKDNL